MTMTDLEQILFDNLKELYSVWDMMPKAQKMREVRKILIELGLKKVVPAGVIPEKPHNIAEYKQRFCDIFAQMENEHGSCEGVELTKDSVETEGNNPYNRIRCKIMFN